MGFSCDSLLESALGKCWWVEPAIASASFALWMNLFRASEVKDDFRKRLGPPYHFSISGFLSLMVYWIGVAGWVAVVPPPHEVQHGCPHSTREWLYMCAELAAGLVSYDFLFFWIHLALHTAPRLGGLVGHARHHQFDGTGDPKQESCHRTVNHSLVDGALQVLVNILVQRHTPWGTTKTRLARWCHNVVITFILVEAHSNGAAPRIARRFCVGVRDHHLHHRHRGPPYQQFFGCAPAIRIPICPRTRTHTRTEARTKCGKYTAMAIYEHRRAWAWHGHRHGR